MRRIETTRFGLKEWRVVVEALREGRQIILLRRGGIHEPRGEFKVAHREFFLIPGLEHQKKELLKPEAVASFTSSFDSLTDGGPLRLDTFAQLVESIELRDPSLAHRLGDHHVWNEAYVQLRIDYKPETPLYLLLLRVFALPTAIEIPRLERYAGCRSWVELDEELSTEGKRAVLEDEHFDARLRAVKRAIGPAKAQSPH